MTLFLEHRNAVVTGATRGIGLAIAKALAEAGASVVICARKQSDVDRTAVELSAQTGSKVVGKAADVSNSGEVADFFKFIDDSLGGLDVLVNNAGVGIFRSAAEL